VVRTGKKKRQGSLPVLGSGLICTKRVARERLGANGGGAEVGGEEGRRRSQGRTVVSGNGEGAALWPALAMKKTEDIF